MARPHAFLQAAVGTLASRVEPVQVEDSVRAVARDMAELGATAVPVARGHVLAGLVTEDDLLRALSFGASPDESVGSIMHTDPPTLSPAATGAEALRLFSESGTTVIVVVDANREVLGVLTPSCLMEHRLDRSYHGRIGGMATPFGVYLTNGVVKGGVSSWALIATGAAMFAIFSGAGVVVVTATNMLPLALQKAAWVQNGSQVLWLALFMVGLRVVPLSGTHGAEHMVVHAIERGEELRPEIVRRMPRVHPRCGTNLAVAAMVFLGIMSWDAIREQELRLVVAMLVTLTLWQPLGNILQKYVTTKTPTDVQLESGLRAGQDFLQHAATAKFARPNLASRLAMSGLFQVFAGATAVQLLLFAIYEVLRVPPTWRVI